MFENYKYVDMSTTMLVIQNLWWTGQRFFYCCDWLRRCHFSATLLVCPDRKQKASAQFYLWLACENFVRLTFINRYCSVIWRQHRSHRIGRDNFNQFSLYPIGPFLADDYICILSVSPTFLPSYAFYFIFVRRMSPNEIVRMTLVVISN